MKKVLLLMTVICTCGCYGEKVERAAGKTLSVYSAIEGKTGNKKCVDFLGACILLQTAEPTFQLSGFEFRVHIADSPGTHNRIELFFNERQSAAFEKLSEECSGEGKRIAFVYQNKVLHAPRVKSKIKAKGVVLDFCNAQVFKIVMASLRGELPPAYDFSKDKAWNMCDSSSEN
jgi:hypothetical protein